MLVRLGLETHHELNNLLSDGNNYVAYTNQSIAIKGSQKLCEINGYWKTKDYGTHRLVATKHACSWSKCILHYGVEHYLCKNVEMRRLSA